MIIKELTVRHSNFYGSYPGIPLHHLALAASGAYTCGSHRTVANRERVLKQLPRPGHSKKQQTKELSLSVKEAYLLIIIAAP